MGGTIPRRYRWLCKWLSQYDDLAGAFLGYPGLWNDQSKGFAAGGTLGFNLQAVSFVYGLEVAPGVAACLS